MPPIAPSAAALTSRAGCAAGAAANSDSVSMSLFGDHDNSAAGKKSETLEPLS
jgi:hypothetical protein